MILRSVSASRERRVSPSTLKLDPAADAGSVAGTRGPVRPERGLQRLLVHVLADRQRLSHEIARAQQGGVSRDREARSATGLARLRRRHGRGLVSAYRRRGVTSARTAAAMKAAGRAKAPALEAHPLDADLTPSASNTGYASTFARASFKTVARRVPPRPIMRHDLGAMSRGYGGVLRSRRDRDNSARASARSSRE